MKHYAQEQLPHTITTHKYKLRMYMHSTKERTGIILVLISAMLWGIFPIVVNRGTQSIPPITFAAITTLLASIGSFFYMLTNRSLHELKKKEAYLSLVMITCCIVIVPYTLFFIGSSTTTSMNSSLLLLSEIIFTLLFTPIIGEKTTTLKLIGALSIFFGAVLILYQGGSSFNTGDLLIIASTTTSPIGNFYAKKL